jgi:putative DNA primase/helicase
LRRLRKLVCARTWLDTSFCLRRPSDHSAAGARFEVHIEKARRIHGRHVKPFEARLETRDGKNAWSMKDVEDAARLRVAALLVTGMTVREIAERQIGGAPQGAAHRPASEEAADDQDEGE